MIRVISDRIKRYKVAFPQYNIPDDASPGDLAQMQAIQDKYNQPQQPQQPQLDPELAQLREMFIQNGSTWIDKVLQEDRDPEDLYAALVREVSRNTTDPSSPMVQQLAKAVARVGGELMIPQIGEKYDDWTTVRSTVPKPSVDKYMVITQVLQLGLKMNGKVEVDPEVKAYV